MPELTVQDLTLHYEDTGGDGRPVVLVHGWPLSGASWSAQVPALAGAGYRVITYDRRGFGESEKPATGYDYDTLAADLRALLEHLDLRDATLVGFSMGGGEVARYVSTYGEGRLASVVFAAAVPPFLLKSDDNPDGGLGDEDVHGMEQAVTSDRAGFLDGFMTDFFSAAGELTVSEEQRQEALTMAAAARDEAVLLCIGSFARTDFRADLATITVPTLVVHGDGDATVPIEVSGRRTHEAVDGSELVVIAGGPHGCNVSHAEEFNTALVDFLGS